MSLAGIFLAPAASLPMQSATKGSLIEGQGLAGDRYALRNGTYSALRVAEKSPGSREPGRQLTMISVDSVESELRKRGLMAKDFSIGDLRRNLVVRGHSAQDLLQAVGHEVQIGSNCRVLVHRHCVPCMYNERKNGIPGLMEAIWEVSGVSCEVLQGGEFTVGDSVNILPATHSIDAGNQSPGYFVPPSQRNAAMVKGDLAWLRENKKQLEEIDPEGADRVANSYESVGLKFWPH